MLSRRGHGIVVYKRRIHSAGKDREGHESSEEEQGRLRHVDRGQVRVGAERGEEPGLTE